MRCCKPKDNRLPLLSMETRYAKMKKLCYYKSYEVSAEDDHNDKDRISNLPNEIVHRILSFLPLEHVAKTCVLSKRWKYLWYSYPCLDFSTAIISSFMRDRRISGIDSAYQKRCDRIDEILRSLEKHCDVRMLKFCGLTDASVIVRSMHLAVKHNVQELDLQFVTNDSIDLPLCVISSLSLRYLRLKSWRIARLRLPPLDATKNCFKSLQSLILFGADFRNHPLILNLFSGSLFPSLAKLHLESCCGLRYFRIQMPGLKDLCLKDFEIKELDISMEKLEKLTVDSCFDSASSRVVIDAPLLEFIFWRNGVAGEFVIGQCDALKEAIVHFYPVDEDLSDLQMRAFWNFLNGISQCRSLTLETTVFEVLLRSRWSVFSRLTSLEVFMNDDDRLWGTNYIEWESHAESLNLLLRHLKVVRIYGFDEWSDVDVVGLVRLLLNNGEVLEQLILLVRGDSSPLREDTKSEIMEFPRASSNVQIIFQ